eukprot:gene20677-27471_t
MCILDFDETLRVVKDIEGEDHQNEDSPAGDAVQVIAGCKEIELNRILSCTNVEPSCVAFFDDMEHNRWPQQSP